MIVTNHTPSGIIEKTLTINERKSLADEGDQAAIFEISQERYTAGTSLPLKTNLLAWILRVLNEEP